LSKYDPMPGAFHMSVTKRAIKTVMENQGIFILEINVFMSILMHLLKRLNYKKELLFDAASSAKVFLLIKRFLTKEPKMKKKLHESVD